MHHDLKTWPQYFQRVVSGEKTFELRKNDRGFQLGDTVTLKEFDPFLKNRLGKEPGRYTGNEAKFRVGYIMPVGDGSFVVFSLLKIEGQ
jgi:hypothetical protein